MDQAQLLIEYGNEHYAHARDHEHLRGQITAILSASAFILIGIAFDHRADPIAGRSASRQ